MIAGKTIVSESVFIDLVKESVEPLKEVKFENPIKNSLAALAKFFDKNADNKQTSPEKETQMLTILSVATDIKHQMTANNPPASISFNLKININTNKDTNYLITKIRDNIRQKVEDVTGYIVDRIDININTIDY